MTKNCGVANSCGGYGGLWMAIYIRSFIRFSKVFADYADYTSVSESAPRRDGQVAVGLHLLAASKGRR